MAANKAMEVLDSVAVKVEPKDRDTLMKIAKTAMMSKSISGSKELMAQVSVDSVSNVAEKVNGKWQVDMDNIQVTKKHGGSMDDTQLIPGIIVDKEPVHPGMPKRVEKAKIALLDVALEIKKTEIDAKIEITDPTQMHAFLDEEERMLRQMVDKIKKVGANVVFCQKGIDDLVQHFLAKEGIYAGRRVKKGDMEKLSKATGATIISKINELDAADLGKADLVEVRKIQEEEMTFVTGCKNPKAMSILIRGGTDHVVAEIERSLDDAMSVVAVAIEDGRMLTVAAPPPSRSPCVCASTPPPSGTRTDRHRRLRFRLGGRAYRSGRERRSGPHRHPDRDEEVPQGRQEARRGQRLHRTGRGHAGQRRHRTLPGRQAGHQLRHRRRRDDPEDR